MRDEKLSYKEAARQFDVSFDTVVAKWERIYLEEGKEGFYIERRGRKSTGRPAKIKKDIEEDLEPVFTSVCARLFGKFCLRLR